MSQFLLSASKGAILSLILTSGTALAQPQLGNNLPNPRLLTVSPAGGKVGTTVEVTFGGTDLEEPKALLFSHPGIKAEPIVPPPPPADPKKPPAKPDPKAAPPKPPPVTKFKVTIPADTPLGIHDVRLVGQWGVSNPRAFMVGDLNEVLEKEPNNDVEQAQRVEINTTINGAISAPTDVDYFVFAGKKGQRVVVSCLASTIDSRLQPGLELYDAAGHLLGFNRHYQDYDALLDCTLPGDGDYYVRLSEFTYTQGSPEHFYRLTITTAPWIDAVFPAVVEPGKPAQLTVYGRNLPDGKLDPTAVVQGRVLEKTTVTVNVPNDPALVQRLTFSGRVSPASSALDGLEYRIRNAVGASNPFLLVYGRAPVVLDNEANHTPETAQTVPVPCEIAGRIAKKHDVNWYAFTAKKNEVYNIDLFNERLGAQDDMVFVLRNSANKQDIGEFDDNQDTLNPTKFFTRTDDPPRYRFVVPADGKYELRVTSRDAGVRSGPRSYYRLSITPDRPDFRLIVMPPADEHPDACRLLQGGNVHFTVLAWREDGFNDTIQLSVEGLPKDVTCAPQSLGPGLRQTALILTAAANAPLGVSEIKVRGTATINGQTVVREARPASITWPVPPQQGIPLLSRLDRSLVLAVREQAPFALTAQIDKPVVLQGDKPNLTLKLTRLWPDFKTPLQLVINDPIPNLAVNNNQPIAVAADKNEAKAVVTVNNNVPPGTYNIVLRATAQIPFNKDPMAKQKPNVNVVFPSTPVAITVLPKQVATLTIPQPAVTAKVGTTSDVVVKVARNPGFAGEFKVQLVIPPNIKGVSADEVTIPAGKDEAKLVLKIAADAAPGNRPDLIVRATAMQNGNVPTPHEAKITVNVVK
jgi:hypothetical protein